MGQIVDEFEQHKFYFISEKKLTHNVEQKHISAYKC